MKRDIHLHRDYPHSINVVWRAITDPLIIKQWMKMETNFRPEVGHEFHLRDVSGNWDGTLYGKVLEVEAPQRLSYSFKGGMMRNSTTVMISLAETSNGTRLTLRHTGFTGLTDIAISGIIGLGWRRMMKDLVATLNTSIGTQ
ncbi:MAG: SRPBCC domain-containing protein [Chloroflexota bacterium]